MQMIYKKISMFLSRMHLHLQSMETDSFHHSSSSHVVHLLCSVSQGLVLGPRMFIMYMADLANFVQQRQMSFHLFFDDSQIYEHCLPSEVDNKLNADMSEPIWTGSRHNHSMFGSPSA